MLPKQRGRRNIITVRRMERAARCCEFLKLRRERLEESIENLTGAPRRRNENQAETARAF